MTRTNQQVHDDVQAEILYDPSVDEGDITVEAHSGKVTLRGSVTNFATKFAAIDDAWSIRGVTDVMAENLKVAPVRNRSDSDIQDAAQTALDWNDDVPEGVMVSVVNGWLTLSGQVEWQYQRNAAYNSVRFLSGVHSFTNLITLASKPTGDNVQERIRSALVRSAYVDADHITVKVNGDTVTLSGNVRSYLERDVIENAAWAAPGVLNVHDNVTVSY